MLNCKWREVRNNEEPVCRFNNEREVCDNEYWTGAPCEHLTKEENAEAEKEAEWKK